VHILDLHRDGHIRPHVDAARYCGPVISGLSLLSPAVMRLQGPAPDHPSWSRMITAEEEDEVEEEGTDEVEIFCINLCKKW
jgi:hypothetical protein